MKNFIKIFFSVSLIIITLFGFAIPLNILSSNWYNQYLPNLNNRPLSDITFVDSLLGFAVTGDNTVGDTNYIIKTTNGGDNWNIIYQIYKDLSRVIFLDNNTGFVSGGYNGLNGIVLKTTNSGASWQLINVPDQLRCDDMAVLNKDTIFIVDQSGFDGVWRTTNSGNNWNLIFASSSILPQKIYMFNQNQGFFSTSSQLAIYRTTNGGFNWTKIDGEDGFSQITFIDSLTGWKASGYLMKKTTNGGLNWVNQPLPTPNVGYISGGMYHFSIINKDTIWGVGGSYQFPNHRTRAILYRTTNCGLNWCFQVPDTSLIKNFGYYGFIQFLNKSIGWAYVSNGIHTINGGDTTFLSIHQISNTVPNGYKLFQNYPNPFNLMTNVKFQMLNNGYAIIKVFDISGREITTLINEKKSPGIYEVRFKGDNLSSGVYFYSLFMDGMRMDTKKMLLIK